MLMLLIKGKKTYDFASILLFLKCIYYHGNTESSNDPVSGICLLQLILRPKGEIWRMQSWRVSFYLITTTSDLNFLVTCSHANCIPNQTTRNLYFSHINLLNGFVMLLAWPKFLYECTLLWHQYVIVPSLLNFLLL